MMHGAYNVKLRKVTFKLVEPPMAFIFHAHWKENPRVCGVVSRANVFRLSLENGEILNNSKIKWRNARYCGQVSANLCFI